MWKAPFRGQYSPHARLIASLPLVRRTSREARGGTSRRAQPVSESKRIVNVTRGGEDVCVGEMADRPVKRMRGLIGRRGLEEGHGLLLRPAPGIHTAFMRFPIDALFLDRHLTVVDVVTQMGPWRVAKSYRARAVLELSAGECERRGVQVGDRLELRDRAQPHSVVPVLRDVARALRGPGENDARVQSVRVVVISDDRRFRAVMSVLLGRRGCEVTTNSSLSRVDDLVARIDAEVVVLDVGEDSSQELLAARVRHSPGVVLVGEDASVQDGVPRVYAKWGSFAELHAQILGARDDASEESRR